MKDFPRIIISKDTDNWKYNAVVFIKDKIESIVKQQGSCSISLAGGSTPKGIYELLTKPEFNDHIDWSKVFFFWGDERCVPHDHADSNYKMVKEALLDAIAIPEENIIPVSDDYSPSGAASDYQKKIEDYFDGKEPEIDVMLLGMGDDGHTASLFPSTDVLSEEKKWVSEVYIEEKGVYRISMTAPLINRAKTIIFLIKGENKAHALNQVLNGKTDINNYPSQLIRKSPEVYFLIDEKAGSLL